MQTSFHFSSRIEEFAIDWIFLKSDPSEGSGSNDHARVSKGHEPRRYFSLASITDSVRIWLRMDQFEQDLPAMLFEACSMLGADLFAVEKLGIYPATCQAIERFGGGGQKLFPYKAMSLHFIMVIAFT